MEHCSSQWCLWRSNGLEMRRERAQPTSVFEWTAFLQKVPQLSIAPPSPLTRFLCSTSSPPTSILHRCPRLLMARIPNPLNLPEFTFRLAQYLDADDFAAFSLVSKSLYASFAPYLWQNIHLGYFSPLEKRNKRYHERLGRFISLAPDAANRHHQKGQPPREDEIDQLLRRVAPWIRALSLHVHHFPRQSILGEQCTHLNTLLITAPPFHKQFDEAYWKACEALVQQNSKWLRSLTLVEWGERFGYPRYDFKPGHPLWTPLFTCAQHANLTSLRLRSGIYSICPTLGSLLDNLRTTRDPGADGYGHEGSIDRHRREGQTLHS
ncbi:hypothetical protein B0O80DRAFT_310354 [Mortierella sp. GBAus27b]|nr:hypothetical protein B0O80DRAFT_310354 [Mortierella sp. GBAus27b]